MLPVRDQLPTRRAPVVTWLLIAVNVIAFLWQLALAQRLGLERLVLEWGLVPARFSVDPLATLGTVLTSMFMHGGWAHLGGNMLFLWIFGDNVEDRLGRGRYLVFYLLSGTAAAAAQVGIDPTSPIPMVGASGAIAGVVAAYGALYPRSPILVLNPFPPLWLFMGLFWQFPAWLVILEFFVFNLINGLFSLGVQTGGVAFFAHLGGFVAGMWLVRWMAPPEPEPPQVVYRLPPTRRLDW